MKFTPVAKRFYSGLSQLVFKHLIIHMQSKRFIKRRHCRSLLIICPLLNIGKYASNKNKNNSSLFIISNRTHLFSDYFNVRYFLNFQSLNIWFSFIMYSAADRLNYIRKVNILWYCSPSNSIITMMHLQHTYCSSNTRTQCKHGKVNCNFHFSS